MGSKLSWGRARNGETWTRCGRYFVRRDGRVHWGYLAGASGVHRALVARKRIGDAKAGIESAHAKLEGE